VTTNSWLHVQKIHQLSLSQADISKNNANDKRRLQCTRLLGKNTNRKTERDRDTRSASLKRRSNC